MRFEVKGGAPGGLGDQEQGVHVRLDTDFVTGDLVVAAAGMFVAGGREALGGFEAGSGAAA